MNSNNGVDQPTVGLLSVNVGEPAVIGMRRGQPVLSGIRKRPVEAETLDLDVENLAGDRQADLRVHGGADKAVYAYPNEHLPLWNAEVAPDRPFGPGSFGENLTVAGWLEHDARIGDVWRWGGALLQVCQPRFPCFKLAMVTARPDIGKRMLAGRRTGWYLRVLHAGAVPTAGPIVVVDRGPANATVRDAVEALLPGAPAEQIERVVAAPALAASWRRQLLEVLEPAARGNAHEPRG